MPFKGFKCQNNSSCYKLNAYNNNSERLIRIFVINIQFCNSNMTAVIHMYLKTTKYVETLLILLNKNLNNVQSFAFFKE